MSTHYFPQEAGTRIAGGYLYLAFINDDGDSSVVGHGGDVVLLKIADTVESVEESGIGGVIRVSDMDVEVYDKGNLFRDTIFLRGTVTKCYAKILFYPDDGTGPFTVMYGLVDLSTLEYPSYYDDEGGVEAHSCKFTIFSVVRELENHTPSELRTAIDADKVVDVSGAAYYVSILDILTRISGLMGSSTAAGISSNWQMKVTSATGFTSVHTESPGANTYLQYKLAGVYANPWNDSVASSFMKMATVKDVLNKIAGDLLCYPRADYDSGADQISITLIKRGSGTVVDTADLPPLKTSSYMAFYGYDAIRIINIADPERKVYPTGISDDKFEVTPQRFDYQPFLSLTYPGSSGNGIGVFLKSTDTGDTYFAVVQSIVDGSGTYTVWNDALIEKFVRYWSNVSDGVAGSPRILPSALYSRTYQGTGFGQLSLMDRLTINGSDYTVIEIRRRLVENEMQVKAALY